MTGEGRDTMQAAEKKSAEKPEFSEYDYSNFYYGAGDDPLNLLRPFARLVSRGAARPATTSTPSRSRTAPTTRVRVKNGKTGAGPGPAEPGLLQLPRHLVPARGQAGGHRGDRALRPGRLGLADPVGHVRRPRASSPRSWRASRTRKPCDPLPDGLQRQRRLHLRAHALGRHHLPRPVLARLDRGRRHPGQVQDRLLPPQQPAGPRAQARKGVKGKKLVVVEGVYSMDGDVCALPEIVEVAQAPRRAHPDRRGALDLPVRPQRPRRRRALRPRQGGRLPPRHLLEEPRAARAASSCGSKDLIDYVNAFGRSRFFSCNLSPVLTAGLLAGLRIVESRAAAAGQALEQRGLPAPALRRGGHRHRQVELAGDAGDGEQRLASVFAVAEKIQDRGLFLSPVTYPAVPKHKSRLRISVSAAHSEAGPRAGGADDRRRPARGGDHAGHRPATATATPSAGSSSSRPRTRAASCRTHLEPVEVHHGTSILAMTAFDFDESEVGDYGEVVYAVIVPPLVARASACPSRRSSRTRSPPPRRPRASTPSSAGTCRTGWRT